MSPRREEPAPLTAGELDRCLEKLAAGVPFKTALEALLLELPRERAEGLASYLDEGGAAWFPLLHGSGGRALLIGNAFSAATHALAANGYRPVLLDRIPARMRFEAFRCEELTGVRCDCVLAGTSGRLPFEDDAFDLVVQTDGFPGTSTGWTHDLAELRRVCRGELVLYGDNRFGYKRWLGMRGSFQVLSPFAFLARALRPPRGERTIFGYRKALHFPDRAPPRALALYPHAADFTHVVGLDGAGPTLHVGPMERRNKLKIIGNVLGLFPVFTPSFALVSSTRELASRPLRIDRVLARLAEELDEAVPTVDEVLATRGNSTLVRTQVKGGDPGDPEGRWCLHLSMGPHQHRQIERHYEVIERLWAEGSPVEVPEPLFRGELEGIRLTCERRLPGFSSPEVTRDPAIARRMFEEVARDFARLVSGEPRVIDGAGFEELFLWRFDLAASYAAREETQRRIGRLCEETRERMLGHSLPLGRFHGDLRGKHVQVDRRGGVLGYLDWGCSVDRDLPYFDLLQLLVHQFRQGQGGRAADSWGRFLTPGGLEDWERAALDRYAETIGLDAEMASAIEHCYPIILAAMSESNWDYSRPRWLHFHFGL